MVKREGIVLDLPEEEYHSHPSLSASGAKLLYESPARFKYQILDGNRQHKAAYDLGSAVHAKVLGTGYPVDVFEFDSWRTKEAREARDESRAAGRIPMLSKEMGPVDAMAEAVLTHGLARRLFEREGHSEVSVFAEDDGVPIRCRFDRLPDEGGIAIDLKTTGGKASKSAFERSIWDFGYDIAHAHYLDTLHRAVGRELEMLFVVVETEPPHLVGVHQLNQQYAQIGWDRAMHARDLYKRGMETGEWPGYPEKITLAQPPMYAIVEHQDRFGEDA